MDERLILSVNYDDDDSFERSNKSETSANFIERRVIEQNQLLPNVYMCVCVRVRGVCVYV